MKYNTFPQILLPHSDVLDIYEVSRYNCCLVFALTDALLRLQKTLIEDEMRLIDMT